MKLNALLLGILQMTGILFRKYDNENTLVIIANPDSADLLCYNYAIYGNDYLDHWQWFPLTYVYANEYNNFISKLARQLISREKINKLLPVFNFDSVESFIKKCELVEKGISEGKYKEYRYNIVLALPTFLPNIPPSTALFHTSLWRPQRQHTDNAILPRKRP